MTIVFRAQDEPADTRIDHWLKVVDETLGPVKLRPPSAEHQPQQLLVGDVGAVRVAETTVGWVGTSGRCEAARTPRLISRSDPGSYKVDVVTGGRMVVQQDGREAELRPGDLTLLDLSRPGRWATSAERSVSVVFPRSLLPLRPADAAGLTAVRIPGDRGAGALVSSVAAQLPGRLDQLDGADGARLGTTMVDLLAVALAGHAGRARARDAGRRRPSTSAPRAAGCTGRTRPRPGWHR
jgi:hypothetical protein